MDIITQYRTVFWFSFIPGIISVLIVVFFVKDLAGKKESIKVESAGAKFSKPFLFFLAVMAVFSLAYFSYAIFILRAADLGVAIALIPIIYLAYNLVYAGLSLPMGKLSDKIGRKNVLLIGFLSFSVVSCGFAFSTSAWQAWALFLVYGFTASIVDSIPRAMVADLVEKEYLGRAYGIYYTVIGIAILPASAFAGRLWDIFGKVNGPIIAFNYGAITAFIAAVLLYFFIPDKRDAEKINSR